MIHREHKLTSMVFLIKRHKQTLNESKLRVILQKEKEKKRPEFFKISDRQD